MMSSGANPANGENSTMPGDYESWPAPGSRNRPFGGPLLPPSPPPSPEHMLPSTRTPFPRIPQTAPTARVPGRTSFPRIPPGSGPPMGRRPMVPRVRPVRHHRRRRRSLTPEIVIDRRPRCHSSRRRRRVITIPFNNRPTLGLRGSSKRCIEIERVRCHRRRRSRSVCYEYDYDDPPPVQPQIQQPTMIANPIINSSLPVAASQPSFVLPTNNISNNAAATLAFLSNLTPEMIDSLPRQAIHLPPIHLPGSRADDNTELDTVTFPAEIINPIDGTLSIIQVNPAANHGVATNIQPITVAAAAQPQLIHTPTTVGVPVTSRGPPLSAAMSTDPAMQRFQELFQRLRFPQAQPMSPTTNPPMVRHTTPNMTQFNPTNNTVNNLPIIPFTNTANIGGYPPANIQPTNSLTTTSYRPTSIPPSIPGNTSTYRPTSIPPAIPGNTPTYRPTSIASSRPFDNMSYRPSSFTPSIPGNNTAYRPANLLPDNSSDIGPYKPANITPYSNMDNQSSNNPLPQSFISSGPTPSATFTPRTTFPRLYPSSSSPMDNNSLNPSFAPTPNQSMNSMPKSILRTTSTITPSNITYTNLNSPNVMSSNDIVRKTTTFT